MSKLCNIEVNGESFSAHRGEILLDAALMNGIDIPHDCRSGYCGTCRVRVLDGRFFGGESREPGVVHACQCRTISDLQVAVEDVPPVGEISGTVSDLRPVAPDVWEVCVTSARPVHYLPG